MGGLAGGLADLMRGLAGGYELQVLAGKTEVIALRTVPGQ